MANQRYIILAFLLGALCVGLTVRSATVEGIAVGGWPDPLVLGLVPASVLVAIAVGIGSFIFMMRHETTVSFVDEVIVELRKVKWPDREETVNSTTVVIVACVVIAGSLAAFDFIWAKVTGIFLFS